MRREIKSSFSFSCWWPHFTRRVAILKWTACTQVNFCLILSLGSLSWEWSNYVGIRIPPLWSALSPCTFVTLCFWVPCGLLSHFLPTKPPTIHIATKAKRNNQQKTESKCPELVSLFVLFWLFVVSPFSAAEQTNPRRCQHQIKRELAF